MTARIERAVLVGFASDDDSAMEELKRIDTEGAVVSGN